MSLTVYKGPFSRSYENEFFRRISEQFIGLFERKGWSGKLYGSPNISTHPDLQIDALLISEHHICLIDFKNYGGNIILPSDPIAFEREQWYCEDGTAILGGNSINPFRQLSKQSVKLEEVFKRHIDKRLEPSDTVNPWHFKRIVCFQQDSSFTGSVPHKRELIFFLTDHKSICNKVEDILDVEGTETTISPQSMIRFDEVFKAPLAQELVTDTEVEEIQVYSESKTEHKLKDDQLKAIQDVSLFLKGNTDVFIINGSSQSGKTFLLSHLKDVAFSNSFQDVEFLGYSAKVVNKIRHDSGVDVNSLYSQMYDLSNRQTIDDPEYENLKYFFPLRENHSDDNTLYIIDEAHLITNSYMQINDLRFGSGFLIDDFIKYSALQSSNRKLIILSDPFIISQNRDKQICNSDYLEKEYKLNVQSVWLSDNKNNQSDNSILGQALKLKSQIQSNVFNDLNIESSDDLIKVNNDAVPDMIAGNLESDFWEFKFLTWRNDHAQKINLWIKQKLLNSGRQIKSGDLVLFHNSVKASSDIPMPENYIRNGDFMHVVEVGKPISRNSVNLKGRKEPIKLNLIPLKVQTSIGAALYNVSILENYLDRDEAELTNDEVLALSVLFEREIEEYIKQHPALGKEQARLQLEQSSFFHNYALVKYGWALTVNRAVPAKFNIAYIGFDPKLEDRGKSNLSYFSWLYSALTRSIRRVNLVGFQGFNCFDKIQFSERLDLTSLEPPKQKSSVDIISPLNDKEKEFANQYGLNHTKIALVRKGFLVNLSLTSLDYKISQIRQLQYQEEYTVHNKDDTVLIIRIYYNEKYQFKSPNISGPDDLAADLLRSLNGNSNDSGINSIESIWRKNAYIMLLDALKSGIIEILRIEPLDDKLDRIYFSRNESKLVVDFYYQPSEGFFSSIVCRGYSTRQLWDDVQNIIKGIKEIPYGN